MDALLVLTRQMSDYIIACDWQRAAKADAIRQQLITHIFGDSKQELNLEELALLRQLADDTQKMTAAAVSAREQAKAELMQFRAQHSAARQYRKV